MKKLILITFFICLLPNISGYCQDTLSTGNDSLFSETQSAEVRIEIERLTLPFETNKRVSNQFYTINEDKIKEVSQENKTNAFAIKTSIIISKNHFLQTTQHYTLSSQSGRGFSGALKGALIGGGIGLLPIVAGQGGAYVAILTFPVGLVTGAIIGGTSKKKHAASLSSY